MAGKSVTAKKSPAKSAALQGNQRAVKSEKVKERGYVKVSLKEERREGLRRAMFAEKPDHWPNDDEVREEARRVAYAAIDARIEQAKERTNT